MSNHHSSTDRVLVLAGGDIDPTRLVDGLRPREGAQVLVVVVPSFGMKLGGRADVGDGRASAHARVLSVLEALDRAGFEANAIVGDANPANALDDALRLFPADEVIHLARPRGRRRRASSGAPGLAAAA